MWGGGNLVQSSSRMETSTTEPVGDTGQKILVQRRAEREAEPVVERR